MQYGRILRINCSVVVILSVFAKIHYKLTLSLYCAPVTCFLPENVGGSEKNRLITVLKFHVDRCCSFRDTCNIISQPFGVVHALYHVTLSPGVQNNHSCEVFDPYLPIQYAGP